MAPAPLRAGRPAVPKTHVWPTCFVRIPPTAFLATVFSAKIQTYYVTHKYFRVHL